MRSRNELLVWGSRRAAAGRRRPGSRGPTGSTGCAPDGTQRPTGGDPGGQAGAPASALARTPAAHRLAEDVGEAVGALPRRRPAAVGARRSPACRKRALGAGDGARRGAAPPGWSARCSRARSRMPSTCVTSSSGSVSPAPEGTRAVGRPPASASTRSARPDPSKASRVAAGPRRWPGRYRALGPGAVPGGHLVGAVAGREEVGEELLGRADVEHRVVGGDREDECGVGHVEPLLAGSGAGARPRVATPVSSGPCTSAIAWCCAA